MIDTKEEKKERKLPERKLYRNRTKRDERFFIYGFNNPVTVIPGGTIKLTEKESQTYADVIEPVEIDKFGEPDKPSLNNVKTDRNKGKIKPRRR